MHAALANVTAGAGHHDARTPESAVHWRSSAKYSSSMGTDQEFRPLGPVPGQDRDAVVDVAGYHRAGIGLDIPATSPYSLSVR